MIFLGVLPMPRKKTKEIKASGTQLDLSHLRRETRTALELAVVALAPPEVTDELATIAGLLEALVELPPNSPPVVALVPSVEKRARPALDKWHQWQSLYLAGKIPRG
jgi:hypothetical protein